MKTEAKVVVIGGGIVGCAILYHLAKAGCKEAVMVERRELTSGSSWHAAGGLHALTGSTNGTRLQKYAQELYPVIEQESGQHVGFHHTGGILLAGSPEEYQTLKITRARGIRAGIDAQFISFEDARELSPVLNTDGLHAVLYEPSKGHVDPSSATHAFAKAARNLGAEIYRHTVVTGTTPRDGGGWNVVTDKGSISCESVVNAAGLWGREVARLAGIELPLMPVEHHYLVTESVPEIEAMKKGKRLCTMAENEDGFYSRQEGMGILLGAYEDTCTHWAVGGTPPDFDTELLPNNIECMARNFEKAIQRMPCLGRVGIKSVINGPMIFSPDLAPLIGPHPELRNYYCAAGVMTGFNQAAGVGRILAEWILDGEPSLDVSMWDVARYGKWANGRYTLERTKLFYENRYNRVYPYQEFSAGRDLRHFEVYERQKQAGAVFGQNYGWETPLWFAREGDARKDKYSYGRGNWHDAVGEEARASRKSAGLFEVSTFAKYRVSGEGAAEWLDRILCNRVPATVGRTVLSPMLNIRGRIIGDFTVSRLGEHEFMLLGAGFMQEFHMRWFRQNVTGGVILENVSHDYAGIHIAGPTSRNILAGLTNEDVSNERFPFLTGRKMTLADIDDCHVFRVSFSGELGYEIYVPISSHGALYDRVLRAGREHELRLCGSRALASLRLEKGFASWGTDLGPDYTPWESNLGFLVKLDKSFIGRDAAAASKSSPNWKRTLVGVRAGTLDASGGEPIMAGGKYVGYVSSGGYGHTIGESLAMCYIRNDPPSTNEPMEIEILGDRYPVNRYDRAPVDPDGSRMRS